MKVLIINSNYYKKISKNLLNETINVLKSKKFLIDLVVAPGVFEIPFLIKRNIKKYDGFIALGCVIKGQTPHFDFICDSTFNALQNLTITFNKPIGNGIITALNITQANARSIKSNKRKPNKGSEAAKAVISVLKNDPKKI